MPKEQRLFEAWLQALSHQPDAVKELESIRDNPEEITDRFYKDLTFGTAGLRGLMGLGTNRMNYYTVGRATKGLASYYTKKNPKGKAVVGYDSRNNSQEFARHTASVMAAEGMTVYIYPHLSPTPSVAFAVRQLGADCGVMVTASHNPKEYNGYKVFNSDGCQIDDDVAGAILEEIHKVDLFADVTPLDFDTALSQGKIHWMEPEMSVNFCDAALAQNLLPEIIRDSGLTGVYTPLYGAGNLYVKDVWGRLGFTDYVVVPEQEEPDGNFPTAPYPNPEFIEALELGLKLAEKENADFLLATDPDADRVAIAVLDDGQYHHLTGNHLGVLLLDYIADTRRRLGTLPKDPVAIRSIVSSRLFDRVAENYGVHVTDVLTGFKFTGEEIKALERKGQEDRFILGYEEACGFLIGTHVRDKDAIVTAGVTLEMLAALKTQGKTAVSRLEEIYKQYGYYSNMAQNLVFRGAEGMEEMTQIMADLRENPPTEIVGRQVTAMLDYKVSKKYEDGKETPIHFRSSNVLEFHLSDGCTIIIRPSGTEPKLKLYYNLIADTRQGMEQLEKEYAQASVELAGVEE